MRPYYENNGFSLIHADVLEGLKLLDSESVQCVVTSPPYWGVRDYGVKGQIGLEKHFDEYIEKIVSVFDQVFRVLKSDGVLWLNMGDTYISNPNMDIGDRKYMSGRKRFIRPNTEKSTKLKIKNLVGIPWRVALALQDYGWILRQDIIWSKPSPMPESVKDRCTKSHEYIFLLSKRTKYYFNSDAIKEEAGEKGNANSFRGGCYVGGNTDNATLGKRTVSGNTKKKLPSGWDRGPGSHDEKLGRYSNKRPSAPKGSFNGKTEAMAGTGQNAFRAITDYRNKRSVWTISSRPFSEAHFATFPPELPLICISAGSQEGDLILDPFNGAGTTGLVARELGRKYVGIDLNESYLDITIERVEHTLNQLTFFDLAN